MEEIPEFDGVPAIVEFEEKVLTLTIFFTEINPGSEIT